MFAAANVDIPAYFCQGYLNSEKGYVLYSLQKLLCIFQISYFREKETNLRTKKIAGKLTKMAPLFTPHIL